MDLRTEKAVSSILGKQALPVLLNGILVYSFYFLRRFIEENRAKKKWQLVDFEQCLGVKNKATLLRLFSVASGTFTAFDIVDATVHSISGKKDFVLRLNFVGIGAFAVALGAEMAFGVKRGRLLGNQSKLYEELNGLTCAQIYFKSADNLLKFTEVVELSEQLRLSMNQDMELTETEDTRGETKMDKAELMAKVDDSIAKAEQFCSPDKKSKKRKPFWKREDELQTQLENVKTLQDMVSFFQNDMIDLMKCVMELNEKQRRLKTRTNFVCILALVEAVAIAVLILMVL